MLDTQRQTRPVSTLTSAPVVSVEPKQPLRDVVERFMQHGIGFVAVLNGGSVAGVVSERDVIRAIHDGADLDEVSATDIMSTDLVTTESDTTIVEAARLMTTNGIRHLLVLGDDGGVLAIEDLLGELLA